MNTTGNDAFLSSKQNLIVRLLTILKNFIRQLVILAVSLYSEMVILRTKLLLVLKFPFIQSLNTPLEITFFWLFFFLFFRNVNLYLESLAHCFVDLVWGSLSVILNSGSLPHYLFLTSRSISCLLFQWLKPSWRTESSLSRVYYEPTLWLWYRTESYDNFEAVLADSNHLIDLIESRMQYFLFEVTLKCFHC